MALNYSVALRPNPLKKDEPAKAYATAQVNGELSLKQLSRRVSMQTTVSRADVVAVLISTVENLLDALQEGLIGETRIQGDEETFLVGHAPVLHLVGGKEREYVYGV